ncbi:hypothetical protein A7C99_4580 [Trichophyton rubrum]|uniref:Acyltransferase 3 domain-containing protein n=4 Tax=Trichophyton TaxID=5550 RepID=A0A178EVG4_TRIRU|nr:hypothetical protein H107_03348 [Trichophyton rubrum CBS 202.88]OAL63928.1 hypothetical protein A7C99_4580 [Trichophyton rubrum]OAL72958.1 hypothetical protein A7D00_2731 [Trichophyton violaceum]
MVTSGESGPPTRDNGRNVKWLDGLRGIASFLVILTHLARAWDYELFSAGPAEGTPRLLQQPVLRIPWQGRIGVTIFAFLTGYVCALKPLRLSGSGNYNASFSSIAKSAFRRPPRLILPATIALLFAWTVAQFGAFKVATRSDVDWFRAASVKVDPSWLKEISRLFFTILSTWTIGRNDYDDHQWALRPLLLASMLVYILLVATMYVKYHFRLAIYVVMILYFHQDASPNTETFGQQACYGMMLSDIASNHPENSYISSRPWLRRAICWVAIALGLWSASYPEHDVDRCGWSNILLESSKYMFPPNVNLGKRFTALGVDLIILGIFLSPSIKNVLSNSFFLWFGRNSFAVYLTHGTLLKTVLTYMVYGNITGEPWVVTKNENGEDVLPPWFTRGSPGVFAICIPIWLVIVYTIAHFWTTYVDSFCARVTQRLESLAFESDNEKTQLPR